jgi:glycerate 2-kinase
MKTSGLTIATLQSHAWGERVSRIMHAALLAVDPAAAVERFVERSDDLLKIAGRNYFLKDYRNIYLVGAGKAGSPMAQGIIRQLGGRISRSLIIVKEGYKTAIPGIEIVEAGHPTPDERGQQATQQVISLVESAGEEDLVICLISGGGSALMTSPASGLTLDDLQQLTSLLLACGADIREINTLRKHLEQVKGGNLARLAAPAHLAVLILSDVVGDPLDVICSGPTVPDPTTYADAIQVLERYAILDQAPPAIIAHLRSGAQGKLPETPKPGDPLFTKMQNQVVGNNLQAAEASLAQALKEGFNSMLLTTYLQGEARQVGRFLGAIARQVAANGKPLPRPACLIAGGETTVTLRGNGTGGRNQEVALGAVQEIAGIQDVLLATLATDGGDGNSDAAGAVVSGESLQRALSMGLNPQEALAQNDSYHFFEPLGDLIMTGPTQTNVNDLAFLFAF